MDRMYEGYRYRDRQDAYVANMNTYHCGTSMIANMVDQGFFVEPFNAPAFFEYIKNLEKMRLISDIDWERYQKELLHERVLFYRALHGNIADATIRIGASRAYLSSQTHNSMICQSRKHIWMRSWTSDKD